MVPLWRSLKSREAERNVSLSDTSEGGPQSSSGTRHSLEAYPLTLKIFSALCPTSTTFIHSIPQGNTSVSLQTSLSPERPERAYRPPEQFSNGITIISLYLNPLPNVKDAPPIENSIHQIMKEASLLYCLPDNSFFTPGNGHAVQEATYACTSPLHQGIR